MKSQRFGVSLAARQGDFSRPAGSAAALRRLRFARIRAAAMAAVIGVFFSCGGAPALGVGVFSYDPAGGQFPTNQGWSAYEIVTSGTGLNASIVSLSGTNVLRMDDNNTSTAFDLPTYYYPWNTTQQQQLITNGLKLTFVTQLLNSGGSNLRLGFNNTLFETQFDNILPDQMIAVPLGAPLLGSFNTIVLTGSAVTVSGSNNFEFSWTINGTAQNPIVPVANPSPATIESSVYFGASSGAGTSGDMYVKLVTMETLIVPEPTTMAFGLAAAGLALMAARRRGEVDPHR